MPYALAPMPHTYVLHLSISVVDPGFRRPGGGLGGDTNFPGGGANLLLNQNFPKNCMKMKEFGPRGGVYSWRPPLDPLLYLFLVPKSCTLVPMYHVNVLCPYTLSPFAPFHPLCPCFVPPFIYAHTPFHLCTPMSSVDPPALLPVCPNTLSPVHPPILSPVHPPALSQILSG